MPYVYIERLHRTHCRVDTLRFLATNQEFHRADDYEVSNIVVNNNKIENHTKKWNKRNRIKKNIHTKEKHCYFNFVE